MIGSIDFTDREDMYEAFKNTSMPILANGNENVYYNKETEKYIIFSEGSPVVWICWYCCEELK